MNELKPMLVTFEKVFTLQLRVEAKDFGDAEKKARKRLDTMEREEALDLSQEGYWESIECEVEGYSDEKEDE